ncbi:MAG: RdgB/HAM1 family non-canonical purine NTP pyrophosphatase [Pseudomonadota bacterium]
MENHKVVLASGNKGKLREFIAMFSDLGLNIIPQNELGVGDVPETGTTFVENAIIKARYASQITGLPAIADDSGIEIDYLKGQPGIYSARFSGDKNGVGASDEKNNLKVLELLKGVPEEQRTARYQCILVYMEHAKDPTPIICQASWEGIIMDKEVGDNGFGYDPLFWLAEFQCSSAQLPPEEKNKISHRGKALKELYNKIKTL